jgi:serine/threonine-protein kinase
LVLPIILDALAGLHALHVLTSDDGRPLNVVHCDVSPENILVGVDGVSRLTDFGVAKQMTDARGAQEITHGKPAYLSPEQIMGFPIDARSDVFAMGVVLYNTLTGTKLFEMPTVEATLNEVCTRYIEPPSTVGLKPPPSLDLICMRALERDPDRRFSSSEEMLLELRRVALREEMLAPPNEIAASVRQALGAELSARRLSVLDASRRGDVPASDPGEPGPGPVPAPRETFKAPSDPPPSGVGEGTIALPTPVKGVRRALLIAASVLAAVIVLMTLLFPDRISKIFQLRTGAVAADGVDLPYDKPLPSTIPAFPLENPAAAPAKPSTSAVFPADSHAPASAASAPPP